MKPGTSTKLYIGFLCIIAIMLIFSIFEIHLADYLPFRGLIWLGFFIAAGFGFFLTRSTVASISEMNNASTISDYLDSMICVVDMNHKMVYVNKAYADEFGISKDSYENQPCPGVASKGRVCDFCAMPHLRHSEVGSDHDFGFFFHPINHKWYTGKAGLLRWPDERLVKFYLLSDATEKKEHLDQQKQYEQKLQEAAKEAQAANVAKSAFIANTSHEIRTPMNSILGYSELALDDNVSAKTRDYLEKIVSNSKWLLNIINDIMDISKIESGSLELEAIPFDLIEIIANCQAAVAPSAIAKRLKFSLKAAPHEGRRLLGDPTKLTQVCINILSNAIKFTNHGLVNFDIQMLDKSENKCTLKFEIIDSGIGMSKEQVAKIFDPFVQADASTTRKYGGSGLGLAITRHLVDAMGGKLVVESTEKVGSKFSFILSFATISGATDSDGSIPGDIVTKPSFSRGEVLVVDDNEMNQGVVCEHLKRVGLTPVVANHGLEAVEIVKARKESGQPPFDLICMDIHMPVMDGIEATSRIITLEVGSPIIAMTANMLIFSDKSYVNFGMDGFIGKPFTSQELWKILIKHIKKEVKKVETDNLELSEDREFFKKMLAHFLNNNKNIYDDMQNAIEADDMVLAHRLAHNLKTDAGHIQKEALRVTATEVEQSLKDGKVPAEKFPELKTILDGVLSEIEREI